MQRIRQVLALIGGWVLADTPGGCNELAQLVDPALRDLIDPLSAAAMWLRVRGRSDLQPEDVVLRFGLDDAATLGLNPDHITYTPLAGLSTATEKARRDAPAIAVCEV